MSSKLYTLPAFKAPLGVIQSEFGKGVSSDKTKMMGYHLSEVNNFNDTFSRFDRIPQCDGRTDKRNCSILPSRSLQLGMRKRNMGSARSLKLRATWGKV